MNTKKTRKKLVLNKSTVASLENTNMKVVYGGIDPTVIVSMCLRCPPDWTLLCSDTCKNCGIQTVIC
jgi:natural product precursor